MKDFNDCTSVDDLLQPLKDEINVIIDDPVKENVNTVHITTFRGLSDLSPIYFAKNQSNKGSKGYKRPYKFHK